MATTYKTPGVYVEEISKFPPSVAEVETAIPAFIGYTEIAAKDGLSLTNVPTKVKSMLEYEKYFGKGAAFTISGVNANSVSDGASTVVINPSYYLYDSLQLYYANGGGDCYIVSIGPYSSTAAAATDFTTGLDKLKLYDEPTIILFPDAVKLAGSPNDYSALKNVQQAALKQCGDLMDRVAILDVLKDDTDGSNFRNSIGMANLKYGGAYTPWLKASLTKKITLSQFGSTFNLKDFTTPGNIGSFTINGYIDKYTQLLEDIDTVKGELESDYLQNGSLAAKYLDLLAGINGPDTAIEKIYDLAATLDLYVKDDGVIHDDDYQNFILNSIIPVVDSKVAGIIEKCSTAAPVTIPGAAWSTAAALANKWVTITTGTGSGQSRKIVSHTPTELTITPPWTTIPDNTSVFQIFNSTEAASTTTVVSPTGLPMSGNPASTGNTAVNINTAVTWVNSEIVGKWITIGAESKKISSSTGTNIIVVSPGFTMVPIPSSTYTIFEPDFIISSTPYTATSTVYPSTGNATSGTLTTIAVAERWPAIRSATPLTGTTPNQTLCNSLITDGTIEAISNTLKLLQSGMDHSLESYEQTLIDNIPFYSNLLKAIQSKATEIPPSGAIAGIYCATDNSRGVWKAPANVSLSYVDGVTNQYSTSELDSLNIDANAGKSINAIRPITGSGIMVMGARTLAGNDNEWRYVPVRRLFNFVEESCKKSTAWAVFEPNDANLWLKVKSMVENFLYNLWCRGALAGAKPDHAYYVKCGINVTMTAEDILNGRLNIEIGMAAVRPAEFIILKFAHKMQVS